MNDDWAYNVSLRTSAMVPATPRGVEKTDRDDPWKDIRDAKKITPKKLHDLLADVDALLNLADKVDDLLFHIETKEVWSAQEDAVWQAFQDLPKYLLQE